MKILNCDQWLEVLQALEQGQVIVYPTETVYGIGCYLFPDSISRIFELKKRGTDKPLSIALSDVSQIPEYAKLRYPELVEQLLPGPVTFILPKLPSVPDSVTAGLPTIGVRVPDHEIARKLAAKPLITTSANISGEHPPTTFSDVTVDADYGLDCGACRYKLPSTIIDLTKEPRVIRWGAKKAEVQKILKNFGVQEKS